MTTQPTDLSSSPLDVSQADYEQLALASPFAKGIFDRILSDAKFGTSQSSDGRAQCYYGLSYALLARLPLGVAIDDALFAEMIAEFVGLDVDALHDSHAFGQIAQEQAASGLRRLRQVLMLRWIWQDVLGLISLERLTHELSCFANTCLCFAKDFVYAHLVLRFGEPIVQAGIKPKTKLIKDEFAIIAMGKLGAVELNLSSDIDLVFVHLGAGDTDGSRESGQKSVENQKFMTSLGRGIIKLMNDVDADGFVFRVDMRLRPWGEGAPLVMTLHALQKYFDQHGRTWERFAWLKARVVNRVSASFFEQVENTKRSFVYRYYVDYTAFSALRDMKTMIVNQQAQRQDLDNIKLGVGGIRDIEFIVQAFLLIYGGHHVHLGDRVDCLSSINALYELDYLDAKLASDLALAYRLFRRVEHMIQARHDEQSQRLPKDLPTLTAIARTLGFEDAKACVVTINDYRKRVAEPFGRMVTDRQSLHQKPIDIKAVQGDLGRLLSNQSLMALDEFMQSRLVASLDNEPKARLDTAYPILLNALVELANSDPAHGRHKADIAVPRLIRLLEAICRRSIYLVMIAENPKATIGLIAILAASAWIAKELSLHPMLLDNFLQSRYLHLPNKSALADILRQELLRVEPFDDEGYLTALRTFKKTQVLAVATADVLGLRHIMKVSDSLTFIAEVVLDSALRRAFGELVAKHGSPKLLDGGRADEHNLGFAVVGYGKLGGIEMSYVSDLDVVFLHRYDEQADTDGARALSGMKFASRLVQKILTYLTTQTRDGRVYELDMRLRPSGNAGVMVVSMQAFELYQTTKAWDWEHQALVRARGVAGDEMVLGEFDRTRLAVLRKERTLSQVQSAVNEMRQKMQTHLGTKDSADKETHQFHIKQDFGGMVDIEFLAQFLVLAHSHTYPSLAVWSDNVRIFEEVARLGIWEVGTAERLTEAYLALRIKTHELALGEDGSKKDGVVVDDDDWQKLRAFVGQVWQQTIERAE